MYNFYHSDGDYIGKMLDEFGLINMPARRNANESGNGRCGVYPDFIGNPVVGRFLSPDIVVQNPNYTQSYNRYSYCVNNPLKYSDPSGWVYDRGWLRWRTPSDVGSRQRAIDLIYSKTWKPGEFNELAGLLDMAGGNSLNNAIDYQDNCGHMINTENSLSNFVVKIDMLKYIKETFGDIPGIGNVYTDGSVPNNKWTYINGSFYNSEDPNNPYEALGITVTLSDGKKDIYIVPWALQDMRVLYVITGHELNHVLNRNAKLDEEYSGADFDLYTESVAYDWEVEAIRSIKTDRTFTSSMKEDLLARYDKINYFEHKYPNPPIIDPKKYLIFKNNSLFNTNYHP